MEESRKVQLLDVLSLSWTDEAPPAIKFMQEIIGTTGAHRDIHLPLPEELRTVFVETQDEKDEEVTFPNLISLLTIDSYICIRNMLQGYALKTMSKPFTG